MARCKLSAPCLIAALLALGSLSTTVFADQQHLAPGTSLSLYNSNGVFRSSALSSPLGCGSGSLADERFSASSVYRAPYALYQPWLARAHSVSASPSAGYWRAGKDAVGEFWAVDLGRDYVVTAVATQGAADGAGWVTKYKVQYSRDGSSFKTLPTEFMGNSDGITVVVNDLHDPVTARYIRLVVDEFAQHIALRAELYGFSPECESNEDERVVAVPCAQSANDVAAARRGEGEGEAVLVGSAPERPFGKGFPLGIEAGIIQDGAFSASSTYISNTPLRSDKECEAVTAALQAGMPMRFADTELEAGEPIKVVHHTEQQAMKQVHAAHQKTQPRFVAGNAANPHKSLEGKVDCNVYVSFAPKFGRLNQAPQPFKSGGWKPASNAVDEFLQVDLGSVQEVDAVATQGRVHSLDWVSSFRLQYSTNGRQWDSIPTPFSANSDPITLVKHVLPKPILTRYLRFVVLSWNHQPGGGIGLRVEAYGPGRGQGCLLRCHAAKLARDNGIHSIDAELAFANGATEPTSLLELGVDATISCCGCGCCDIAAPGTCGGATSQQQAAPPAADKPLPQAQPVEAAVSDAVRVLLRGSAAGGGENPAYGGNGAKTAVAAVDQKVAATVNVPQAGKTFYVVQKDE